MRVKIERSVQSADWWELGEEWEAGTAGSLENVALEQIDMRRVSHFASSGASPTQLATHLCLPVKHPEPPADRLRLLYQWGGSPAGRRRELG